MAIYIHIYEILCLSLAGSNSGERRLQGFKILNLHWLWLKKVLAIEFVKTKYFKNIFSVVNKYEYEGICVPSHIFENLLRRKSKELEDVCVKWYRSVGVYYEFPDYNKYNCFLDTYIHIYILFFNSSTA